MGELSDMERDARHAAEALARLASYVRMRGDERDAPALQLAEDGAVAAERVLAYLQELRGWSERIARPHPPSLGPRREWHRSDGHLFELPERRSVDRRPAERRPGERRPGERRPGERRRGGDPGE